MRGSRRRSNTSTWLYTLPFSFPLYGVNYTQVRVWPIARWAVLGNPAGVFADVP